MLNRPTFGGHITLGQPLLYCEIPSQFTLRDTDAQTGLV